MQQMSSAQIVSATSNMHSRMVAPPVSYGGFWQHPGLGGGGGGGQATQDVKPFAQSPFLTTHGDKTPTSLGKAEYLFKKDKNINIESIYNIYKSWGGGGASPQKKG
jgi:hypothetical protein